MSNTCHNELIVNNSATQPELTAIERIVGGHYLDDSEHFGRDRVMHFRTAWSPPIDQVHIAQDIFPDLSIELQFSEPMTNLFGAVLPDGRLRENVVYEHPQCEYHDLGHKIWDRTGKQLLEDHSKPVPVRLRMERKMWCLLDKLRRKFRPDPVYTDTDGVPF